MNGTLYNNPTFPTLEDDYIQSNNNVTTNNIGKEVKAYFSFKNENQVKEFNGRLELLNKDYIILSKIDDNEYILLPTKNLDYLVFNEKISI